MKKYIEEMDNGECFMYNSDLYIITSDFRKNKNLYEKKCIAIKDGSCRWMSSNSIVDKIDLFYRDKDNNILLCKEFNDEAFKKN
jgi:hypothetical protein